MNECSRATPARRVVLVGASNLVRGLRPALDLVFANGPAEILWAHGRGRSYVGASLFLGRELPGLLDCGLWNALARGTELPTSALVMDVGNDLAYGFEPERVLFCVRTCVERLQQHAQRVSIAGLPWQNLARLGPLRFQTARMVFFRGRAIDREHVRAAAREVDIGLQRLARELGASFVACDPTWIGWDGFHHSRSERARAFASLLEPILPSTSIRVRHNAAHGWIAHAERKLFGQRQEHAQPCLQWPDGSALSLF